MSKNQIFTRLWLAMMIALLSLTFLIPTKASAQEEKTVIAAWNLEWFFDADASDNQSDLALQMTAPNLQEYDDRVNTIADAIAQINPTVLSLEEIENAKVVQDLADRLLSAHGLHYSVAFVQGGDTFTEQDVAFLIKEGVEVDNPGSRFEFTPSAGSRNVSKHLRIDVKIDGEPYTFVAVHLLASNATGRQEQAHSLRSWITTEVDPASTVVVMGDFNAGQRFNQTTPDSEIGIIRGFETAQTDDDLFDVHMQLADRATHVSGKELDRILVEPQLRERIESVQTHRELAILAGADQGCDGVCYGEPIETQDLSDHFPLVLTLFAPAGPEATVTPEATPTALATPTVQPTATGAPTLETLNDKLDNIEAQIDALRQQLEEIKALITALTN